jgi:hypothetical protein
MAPRNNTKRTSDVDDNQTLPKKSSKSHGLPPIPWTADSNVLIWKLVGEVEKSENYKVLFGKRTKHEVSFYGLCRDELLI